MIKFLCTISLLTLSLVGFSQTSNKYRVEIDLTATDNDQVPVTIYPPASQAEFVEYHMPKVVPGTYSISDFGRFITDFKAYNNQGNELTVESLSINRWKISNGGELSKITYKVHDTRDAFESYNGSSENIVFEPGGTEINEESQLYVLNTFGFVGYLAGMKFQPYELSVRHPETIYGATALKRKSNSATEDVFVADDYNFLADGPIMYCEPDTISRQIANAKVIVSVYSPNKVLSAKEVMDNITDLMEAQSKYLGGKLPVDRYAYLITLFDDHTFSGGYGALEHSYSSLYYFPENAGPAISQTVRDIAAHEFFHIVTPLNVHADQIGDFDYIEPKMSAHLWMYEGVTEYSSMHVQVKYGLYDLETFLEEIGTKMRGADEYPSDISFTEMSERILEKDYEPMYGNVYQKGSLIGMCLDLFILKYSNGEKDLPWLMQELSRKYGMEKSFRDDELFDVIAQLTYREVGEFLEKHVAGTTPLPFDEVFDWVGLDYSAPQIVRVISMGKFSMGANEKGQLIIADASRINAFGKDLGLKTGDALININGDVVTLETMHTVFEKFKNETKTGDKVYYTVEREKKGKIKTKKLKAKAIEVDAQTSYSLKLAEGSNADQKALLKAWVSAD